MKRKWMAMVLPVLLMLLVLPCGATVMEHDGLQVTIVTDKEHYEPGESITATITVENIGNQTVNIASLEQLIPEGYELTEGSQAVTENIDLSPGEMVSMDVTFANGEETAAEEKPEDFLTKLIEGQTFGLPNLLLAVLAVIAVAVFMVLT